MKMKETLKFLKFGLIGVASVTAISTLAISCKKSGGNKVDTNNQEQIKQNLLEAKRAFTITPKGDHSQVFASDIANNETKLKQYFNVTPGKEFGEDIGFIYTFKSAKPKGASSLDVVYKISYKDTTETTEVTRTLTKFKDKLVHADSEFKLQAKSGQTISNIDPKSITNEEQLKTYFDFVGTLEDVTYKFLESKPSGQNNLEVKYTLSYEGEEKVKTIILTGFRDVNQIDFNPDTDGWRIAFDKAHLNTIAFLAQEYNFYTQDMFKKWTLTTDTNRYEANKTNQYFILGESKYYIYEIKFKNTEDSKPISVEFGEAASLPGSAEVVFTPQGAKRNPFLFAVKETVNQN